MSSMSTSVQHTAFVTGGGSGFGLAIAKKLLSTGSRVAIGDINADHLTQARDHLGKEALYVTIDVTSPSSTESAVAKCAEKFGGISALINSAGIINITPLSEISEREWDQIINVDLKGVFLCSKSAAPFLGASGRGRIINIGSDASHTGFPMLHHYCAAKHGVIGLTKSLAAELAPHKVTVNCVCPIGTPATGMGQQLLSWKTSVSNASPSEIIKNTAETVPLGRNGTVDDVVHTIMFLLSEEANFITGISINVDGGRASAKPIAGANN